MLNGKAPIVYLSVGLIKKTKWKWVNIFQNQNPEGKVKVELDLSNYAKKSRFKKYIRSRYIKIGKKVDLSNLKSNVNKSDIDKSKNIETYLSNLKSKVDKSEVDKLVPVADDLSKVSDVVKKCCC